MNGRLRDVHKTSGCEAMIVKLHRMRSIARAAVVSVLLYLSWIAVMALA